MTAWHRISIDVHTSKLSTVVDLLSKEGRNLRVEDAVEPAGPKKKNMGLVKKAKAGEPTPMDLFTSMLKSKNIVRTQDLAEVLQKNGYALTTASPTTIKAVNTGVAERIGPALFRLKSA